MKKLRGFDASVAGHDSVIGVNQDRVGKTELFDAASDDFPKLTKSNIVNEISNLNYKLRVTQLDQFLIEKKKY